MEALSGFSTFLQAYIIFITGIVGLIIGSFLNVVSLRLFSEESIVFPGSKCPKCQKPIARYDNIPVLSYFLLKGKCRNCKESISVQYPIVEAVTGLLFIAVVCAFGLTVKSFCFLILISALVIITITDLKEKLIFDITSIPLIPLGLIFNFFDLGNSGLGSVKIGSWFSLNEIFISAIIGAIIGAAFFELFSRLGLLIVGEYAFGTGDSIIGAALGAWFGWQMIIVILALSFIVQLIVGIPIIMRNMYKDKDYESITFMSILIFSVFIPYLGRILGLTENILGALLVTFFALGLAITGIIVILKKTKERQSFTFLPFGPALVVGGLIVMFWGQDILAKYMLNFKSGI